MLTTSLDIQEETLREGGELLRAQVEDVLSGPLGWTDSTVAAVKDWTERGTLNAKVNAGHAFFSVRSSSRGDGGRVSVMILIPGNYCDKWWGVSVWCDPHPNGKAWVLAKVSMLPATALSASDVTAICGRLYLEPGLLVTLR